MGSLIPAGEPCIGCQAKPGERHDEEFCYHAHCTACGGQRTMCDMDGVHGEAVPSVWSGESPIDVAAREFNMFKPFELDGEIVIVEDDFRVRTELAWNPGDQRFVAHTPADVKSDGSMCSWITAGS